MSGGVESPSDEVGREEVMSVVMRARTRGRGRRLHLIVL
jgi:hypothetical protein